MLCCAGVRMARGRAFSGPSALQLLVWIAVSIATTLQTASAASDTELDCTVVSTAEELSAAPATGTLRQRLCIQAPAPGDSSQCAPAFLSTVATRILGAPASLVCALLYVCQ